MPIEFSCPNCQKLLTTREDKAGKTAKCPGCGEPVTVPFPDSQDWEASGDEMTPAPRAPSRRESSSRETQLGRPASGERDRQPCPMCGEPILAAAVKCRYCGELLDDREVDDDIDNEGRGPREVAATEVFERAWKIFGKNPGLLIGSWVLSTFIQMAFYLGMMLLIGLLSQANPGQPPSEAGLALILIPGLLLFFLLSIFLNVGLLRLNLNVARGMTASIADVFSGGPHLFHALAAGLLFGVSYTIGIVLCVIPGILALMALWPMVFLAVDRKQGPIMALQESLTITRPNFLNIFLLGLIMFGLQLIGVVTCYLGFIVTVPLIFQLFTVAYLMMSGQRTARV
ncbi:MAG TPA: hypothetical protein DDY91_10655 [Planctomycetaceae bacterium]|nr:hypothetical protein [Planctomycetaceae bacterium]